MLFVWVEPTLKKRSELFYFNCSAVCLNFRILLHYFIQYVVGYLLFRLVTFHVESELNQYYFFSMYPFKCSFDISICKIDIMKHKFRGFSIPAGGRANFLVAIGITGKAESFAKVGPPP